MATGEPCARKPACTVRRGAFGNGARVREQATPPHQAPTLLARAGGAAAPGKLTQRLFALSYVAAMQAYLRK